MVKLILVEKYLFKVNNKDARRTFIKETLEQGVKYLQS